MPRKPKAENIEVPSTVMVERSIDRVGGEQTSLETDSDIIAVHQFVTAPAEVGATLGLTLSLGNYEFARIDVSCRVPCYKEEVSEAYDFAFNFAETRLQSEVAEFRRQQKKNTNKD